MQLKEAVTRLNDADPGVRDTAMSALVTARGSAVPALVEGLKVPGAAVARIALLLAALKARQGVRPLAELVQKGVLDFDARAVVARAFGELVEGRDASDDVVKRAILQLSRDPSGATRQLVIPSLEVLAAGGAEDAEARLAEMAAGDREAGAKDAAALALLAIRASRPPVAPAAAASAPEEGGLHLDLESLVAEHQRSAASAGAAGGALPEPTGPYASLVLRLRDPRWAVRGPAVEEAVQLSGTARAEVVATLVEVLSEAAERVGARIGAAQALARIQATEAARALLDAALAVPTTAEERELRPIALKALASSLTGAEEGFAEPLVPLVKDADPFVCAGALLCLGRLADRVGARAATVALTDPHEHVKEAAAIALSEGTREDDQDLVLPLLAILGGMPSPTVAVREAILLALARIHVEDPAVLLRLRHRVRPSVLGMTASLRRTAIAILERCYTADDPPPIAVIDDVLGRLADDHPEVRLLAASFLAAHLEPGLTGAVEALEDALDREERSVSLLSLEALRRHDTKKARLALEAAAEDPDEVVAARARHLLEDFVPRTEEWSVPANAPPPARSPAPSTAQAARPERAAPASTGRVRPHRGPARAGGAEVVEARDASATDGAPRGPRLRERLRAAAGLPTDEAERERARCLADIAAAGGAADVDDKLGQLQEAFDAELISELELRELGARLSAGN
jgi:hypothetical protein